MDLLDPKNIINFHAFWTSVKQNLESSTVSKTAEKSNLMVVVGGPRAEQTQDFAIFKKNEGLHVFGEVFVDLRPEGCPNPPESCPKPLGFWFWTYGALPIGP